MSAFGRAALPVAASLAATFGIYKIMRYYVLGRWEWVVVGKVSSLHGKKIFLNASLYPVKSCRGGEVQTMELDRYGATRDRRFIVVDEQSRFVTQRQEADMALLKASVDPSSRVLTLEAPGMPQLKVTPTNEGERFQVGVWDDTVLGVDQGVEASEWLTRYLKRPLRLMGMASDFDRPTAAKWTPEGALAQASFSDGFPLLIATEASLKDLNSRLTTPLPMNRFRPNIVVDGPAVEAWAEDKWQQVRIGGSAGQVLSLCKPCSRCKVTTTDQATGERAEEPLVTLGKFRAKRHLNAQRSSDGARAGTSEDVFFGVNACHSRVGSFSVGDAVEARVWVW